MIGIFDANVDKLTKSMKKHNHPFNILADDKYIFLINISQEINI